MRCMRTHGRCYPPLRSEHIDALVDGITPFEREVYQQLATYCFGEAVCWPSQDLLARDLGCHRLKVNRAIGALERAGWLTRLAKRWSPLSHWQHNVYELLEPWKPISRWVSERIVERGKRRYWARLRAMNTNRNGCPSRGLIAAPEPPPRSADKLPPVVRWRDVGRSGNAGDEGRARTVARALTLVVPRLSTHVLVVAQGT